MIQKFWITAWLLLLTTWLVACGRDTVSQPWIVVENETLGIAFEMPQAWIVREDAGAFAIANSARTLDEDLRFGAAITFLTGTTSAFGFDDPQQLLQLFVDAFTVGEEVEVLEEIRPITVNTYEGVTTTLRGNIGGQTGIFQFLLIRDGEQVVLLLISTGNDNRYAEAVDHIVNSLQLTP